MKNTFTCLSLFLFCCAFSWHQVYGQVGINTTAPDAMLDIRPSDVTNPEPTDGILIPRIDAFPATNPTAAQDGMMVFLTGAGIPSKGFYYWNQSTTAWIPLASGQTQDADWFRTETTEVSTTITDSIFTLGNVAIGKDIAESSLDILNHENERAVNILVVGEADNPVYGDYISIANNGNGIQRGSHAILFGNGNGDHRGYNAVLSGSGSGTHTGSYVTLNGNGEGSNRGFVASISGGSTGEQHGSLIDISTSTDAMHFGHYSRMRGTGLGSHFGFYSSMENSGNGNQYGMYNNISNSGNGSHFGVETVFSGSGSGFHTGIINRFSSGTGNLTGAWTEFSGDIGNGNQIGAYNSYFAGGDGILAGNFTEIRNTVAGNGLQYGSFVRNSSPGDGTHYGFVSVLNDVGNGGRTGVLTTISNSGIGNHYGMDIQLSGTGDGFHTGVITRFTAGTGNLTGQWNEFSSNIGNGNQIGAYNSYFAGGNGILAGSYTDIRSTVSGNGSQYGTFSTNSSVGTGDKYGVFTNISASAGGTHYGVYSSATNANGWSGYFLGRMYISQNVGVRINEPTFNIHLKQSSNTAAGEGGVGFENATNTNNWKIYNSGLYLSFAENGVRRSYVTNGTGAYVETSDRRLKKHITPINEVMSKLMSLNVKNYLYQNQDDSAKMTIGFIAQDIQPLFPELVEIDEDGYYGLNYSGFGVLAIKAIQEQQALIERLEKRIEELEQKLK
jgi:trimeric autotransporter adhesin